MVFIKNLYKISFDLNKYRDTSNNSRYDDLRMAIIRFLTPLGWILFTSTHFVNIGTSYAL